MPTNFMSFGSFPRGPAPGPSTQYYDLGGNLVQGDINEMLASRRRQYEADLQRRQSAAWRRKAFGTLAGGAALFGGAAGLGALAGGAGAAGGSTAIPLATGGSTAIPGMTAFAPTMAAAPAATAAAVPGAVTTAARFTLPNILRMAEIGVPAVTGVLGMRAQNRALDRQSQLEERNLNAQMAYARELEAQRRAEAERMFIEDQRRWESEERNRQRDITAAEEERAFTRRLLEEREARRAPYRQMSQDALYRLTDLLRMGRR